jgi:hypothetical protein
MAMEGDEMHWVTKVQSAIDFIENHLLDDLTPELVGIIIH